MKQIILVSLFLCLFVGIAYSEESTDVKEQLDENMESGRYQVEVIWVPRSSGSGPPWHLIICLTDTKEGKMKIFRRDYYGHDEEINIKELLAETSQ